MDRLRAMEVFAEVARRRSFGQAARALGLPPSSVSRAIVALEKELGARLLLRTTRRVSLTEAGESWLEPTLRALDILEQARASARRSQERPSGLLRIQAPVSFGRLWVGPELPALLAAHPDLSIELTLSDAFVDLVAERADVAVRVGRLAPSALRARKLAVNRRVLCAAPSYLAHAPPLRTPEELERHRLLHFSPLTSGRSWVLTDARGRVRRVAVRPVLASDNAEVLRTAALAGSGVALLATFLVGADLAAGRLVRVLDGWSPPPTTVHAIHAGGRAPPAKVSAFVEHLARRWRGTPPWE